MFSVSSSPGLLKVACSEYHPASIPNTLPTCMYVNTSKLVLNIHHIPKTEHKLQALLCAALKLKCHSELSLCIRLGFYGPCSRRFSSPQRI